MIDQSTRKEEDFIRITWQGSFWDVILCVLPPFFQPAFVHCPCPASRFCFVFAYKIINLKCQKPPLDMNACRGVWSLSKLNRWASSTSHWERVYPACILPFLPLSTSMLSVSQQAVCDSVKIHVGQNSHELNSALAKECAGVILGINKHSNDDTGWILARKVCCAEGRWEESLGAMQQSLERGVGSTETACQDSQQINKKSYWRRTKSMVPLGGRAACGGGKYSNLSLGAALSRSAIRGSHCSEMSEIPGSRPAPRLPWGLAGSFKSKHRVPCKQGAEFEKSTVRQES